MKAIVDFDAKYVPSEDIIVRERKGELIIVLLVSGIGDMEDEFLTLNETGKAIWDRLDGKRRFKDVMKELLAEFEAPAGEIEGKVIGLVKELLKRRMIVEAPEE